jgi:hypothetical protein
VALVLAAGSAGAQVSSGPERFTAQAVNMSSAARSAGVVVEIQINRWSPQADWERLIGTLIQEGPDAMLRRLQGSPELGFIRVPTQLGHALLFARQMPTEEGGRRIVILTDRQIGIWETQAQPRSIDYPLTLIEIHLDRDGMGEGTLLMAARIRHNKADDSIEFEDYSESPVQLRNVKAEPVRR